MKKMIHTFLPLILVVLCCSSPREGARVQPSGDPAASDVPATLFVFRDGGCTRLVRDVRTSALPVLSLTSADRVALVAYTDPDNVFFSEVKPGKDETAYYLGTNVPKMGCPRMWAGTVLTGNDTLEVSPELRRVTASVTLTVKQAPALCGGARVELPQCQDSYYPATGAYAVNDPARREVLSVEESGSLEMFPAVEAWKPVVNLLLGEETVPVSLPVEWTLSAGQDVLIEADFSAYDKTAHCRLTFSCGDDVTSVTVPVVLDAAQWNGSSLYNVLVRRGGGWQAMPVRDCLCSDAAKHRQIWNDWDNAKALRDTMSYCIFEDAFTGPVEVLVQRRGASAAKAQVRPTPWGITPEQVGEDMLRFVLPSYDHRKVSVEFDGDRQHNLFLLPHRPEQAPSGDKVKYYGPGEHNPGIVDLYDGETLYLDYGAVLYAEVRVHGDDCTIAGHGVLSGDKLRHWGEQYSNGAIILSCNPRHERVLKNLTVKDITIINGPSWNLSVFNFDGVKIDGVNIIGWELNGDGIDIVCCRNVEIQHCFLRNYDDCITVKVRFTANPVSDCCDVYIHDNLIWNDYARGIVIGPEAGNVDHGTGYLHDIRVEDCIILQHKAGVAMDDLRAGFAIGQYASPDYSWAGGTAMPIRGVHAKNLIFDSIDKTGRNVAIRQYREMNGTCTMSDITLENFTIYDANAVQTPACHVMTNQHSVSGLHIKNMVFDGRKITAAGPSFVVSGNVEVDFE